MSSLEQKKNLSSEQLQLLHSEFEQNKKNPVVTWLLWLFLGGFGGHRFYLGRTGTAVAQLLTLGGLGFWSLIDVFLIQKMIREENEKIENNLMLRVKN